MNSSIKRTIQLWKLISLPVTAFVWFWWRMSTANCSFMTVVDTLSNKFCYWFSILIIAEHRRRISESNLLRQSSPQKCNKATRNPSEIELNRFIVTTSIIRNVNSTKFSFRSLQTPRVLGLQSRRLRHVHKVQQTPNRDSTVSAAHGHVLQATKRCRDWLEQIYGIRETDQISPTNHRLLVGTSIDTERGRSDLGLATGVADTRLCCMSDVLCWNRADINQLRQTVEKDQKRVWHRWAWLFVLSQSSSSCWPKYLTITDKFLVSLNFIWLSS